ncbi:unnamed protein product [Zymoseptoria tritici ST99CH_1E4]|uniref:Uncharacterized protein n=1 Tax=Zymoseptoria tritici ST99CH_1E4 TaxID=1276532 RepID=A0A2H1H820_ZYMTR|nr:unnamed protein product [Zymoseptoria tritici ST99CH_1E4]
MSRPYDYRGSGVPNHHIRADPRQLRPAAQSMSQPQSQAQSQSQSQAQPRHPHPAYRQPPAPPRMMQNTAPPAMYNNHTPRVMEQRQQQQQHYYQPQSRSGWDRSQETYDNGYGHGYGYGYDYDYDDGSGYGPYGYQGYHGYEQEYWDPYGQDQYAQHEQHEQWPLPEPMPAHTTNDSSPRRPPRRPSRPDDARTLENQKPKVEPSQPIPHFEQPRPAPQTPATNRDHPPPQDSHHGKGQWTEDGYSYDPPAPPPSRPPPQAMSSPSASPAPPPTWEPPRQVVYGQANQRPPLGPPPSARRAPAPFYPETGPVYPIVEESESMRGSVRTGSSLHNGSSEHMSKVSYASSNAIPIGIPQFYLDGEAPPRMGRPDLASSSENSLVEVPKQAFPEQKAQPPVRPTRDEPPRRPQDDARPRPSRDDATPRPARDDATPRPSRDDAPRGPSRDDAPRRPSRDDIPRRPAREDEPRQEVGTARKTSIDKRSRPVLTDVRSSDKLRSASGEMQRPHRRTESGRELADIQRSRAIAQQQLEGQPVAGAEDVPTEEVVKTEPHAITASPPDEEPIPLTRMSSTAPPHPTSPPAKDPEVDPRITSILRSFSNAGARSPPPQPPPTPPEADLKTPTPGYSSLSDRRNTKTRPPNLDVEAVHKAEARGSLSSLPELIRRATRLASNLDRGKTASRLGIGWMLDPANGGGGAYAVGDLKDEKTSDVKRPTSLGDKLKRFSRFSNWDGLAGGEEESGEDNGTGHGIDGSRSARSRGRGRGRICGMPMWVFVVLLLLLVVLVAAAVVVPIMLIVVRPGETTAG